MPIVIALIFMAFAAAEFPEHRSALASWPILAHHGRHMDDGVTHYKGNYGNLLFFWDILFGTARITRKYLEHYGVENLAPVAQVDTRSEQNDLENF